MLRNFMMQRELWKIHKSKEYLDSISIVKLLLD